MAVTKAQLVVWVLISGLSAWGYTVLSRVDLPDEDEVAQPSTLVVAPVQQAEQAAPTPAAPATEVLPATVPVFPFPDDLVAATVGEPTNEMPASSGSFVEIPDDAIPQISTVGANVGAPPIEPELAETTSALVETDAPLVASEKPPIPMPSRPLLAQPPKTVPLSEVKTLYVVADALNVRATPSTSGPVLQKLPQGFAVAAREQANEWIGFLMRDGSTGWMRTDYLSDTMPPAAPTSPVRVWTEPLNLMM